MGNKFFKKLWYTTRQDFSDANIHEVEMNEEDDYTDEIEKALWDIKESFDLPTEEVEVAVESRHKAKKRIF